MPYETFHEHTHRYTPTDPRLGRHVRHDSRSERYAVGVLPKRAVKKVRWTRRIPILNQGNLGSCTFNAFTGLRGTDNAAGPGVTSVTVAPAAAAKSQGFFTAGDHVLDEDFAVAGYSLETRLDSYPGQYPPTDTGSDALGAMAAGQALGLVGVYQHAFSYAAAVSAVQSGGLLWGTLWLNSMFDVDKKGYISVITSSGEAGGHELVLSGYDPENDEWTMDNSWDSDWGQDGSAKIKGVQLTWLLSRDGDITLPTWTTSVPPQPVPDPPVPPVSPAVTDDQLWSTVQAWHDGKQAA